MGGECHVEPDDLGAALTKQAFFATLMGMSASVGYVGGWCLVFGR